MFNAFNHPNFFEPDTNLGDANFGTITAAYPARSLQFAGNSTGKRGNENLPLPLTPQGRSDWQVLGDTSTVAQSLPDPVARPVVKTRVTLILQIGAPHVAGEVCCKNLPGGLSDASQASKNTG
jgi:hypothetical protein